MKFAHDTAQVVFDSPLGTMHLAATPRGLAGAWFAGQKHAPESLVGPEAWPDAPLHPILSAAQHQLAEYFDGRRTRFELTLDWPQATRFQQTVWQALQQVICGHTLSYGQLAQQAGHPEAIRAVAAAVGRNPFSIIVPCHRVLGRHGELTGYAGGLDRKAALLTLEGATWRGA